MEGQIRTRLRLALALTAVIALATAARPGKKDEQPDNLVRLMKAESIELLEINGQACRKAIASTFLHNGTYLISDTALWNVDTKVINLWGHVKVIQDETILTSEKLDYFIDSDLAEFRGGVVQLQNKKRNILRTKHLDYNTKDSVALFRNGAAMRNEDGQLIESRNGSYNSRNKMFDFQDDVNMFTDSVLVLTRRLFYDSEREKATFPHYIDFWKGGNMLSAEEGWYERGIETFFFRRRVHGLTDEQEFWGDSLFYNRATNDVLLKRNAQVQDTLRNVAAMGHIINYCDSLKKVTLERDAAVALFNENKGGRDTIYIGADKLIYWQMRRCDIPDGTVKSSETRLSDILTDAVTEYRIKAAQAAREAEEKRMNPEGTSPAGKGKGSKSGPAGAEESGGPGGPDAAGGKAPEAGAIPPPGPETAPLDSAAAAIDRLTAPGRKDAGLISGINAPADSLKMQADSLGTAVDSLVTPPDSLGATADSLHTALSVSPDSSAKGPMMPRDSIAAPADSLMAPADSLGAQKDSLAGPPDTTKLGFALALRNVKIFRRDLQVRCDSMAWSDLDSIACFYNDPIVWNEGNRQYTSDSLFVLVGGGGARKASLQSNAFIVTQDDEICYDQIKGAEIMAYFDSLDNTLKRFDALGGASALFYLEENGALATANKVESKMLSGILKEGAVDQVFYFESPKNNAYPVVQLPEEEKRMKGFSWRPDERPASPEDVTPLQLRTSERRAYRMHAKPKFAQADIYFPGYMPGILREIAVRDSLAKLPKPKKTPVVKDTVPTLDSLMMQADSIASVVDSLVVKVDSLKGKPELKDSLGNATTPSDSLKTTPEVDPLSVPTLDPKQKRKEEREMRRKLRQAERDARQAERERRWAQLDSLDAAKAEARRQKQLEKERARKIRILKAQRKRELRENAKLLRYIEYYQKQYEREQKLESARKRTPPATGGGEIPTPLEPREQTLRGHTLLRDDGAADDGAVLGSGGVPGP